MKNKSTSYFKGKTLLLMSALFVYSTASNGDAFDDAVRLCDALMGIDMVTKCNTTGSVPSVDATIATSASEARKMCPSIVQMVSQYAQSLSRFSRDNPQRPFKMRIISPYSNGTPIASCKF